MPVQKASPCFGHTVSRLVAHGVPAVVRLLAALQLMQMGPGHQKRTHVFNRLKAMRPGVDAEV